MPPSYRVSHPRPSSHLTLHRGILYFRILVPNHLQSLLGKCEIRRSLNGLDSRTARSKALRLSLVAQHFFALSEDLVEERIHSVQDNISQQFGITKENIQFHTEKRPVSSFPDPLASLFSEGTKGNPFRQNVF